MTNPLARKNKLLDHACLALATCFYISYLPAALARRFYKQENRTLAEKWTGAGLLGSFVGVFLYALLPLSLRNSWVLWGAFCLVAVGVSSQTERFLKRHDDSRIVIDEVAGVWLTLIGLAPGFTVSFVAAFLFFRLFDVWKGPWNRSLQKWPEGWGIVADDVAAGIMARATLTIIQAVANHLS